VQGLKAGRPTWSPDGRTLAFTSLGYAYLIASDAVDGTATRLRRYDLDDEAYVDVLAQNGPIAWSPSGRYLVYEGGGCTGIYDNCMTALDLQTGWERVDFAYGGGGSYSGRAYSPDWLPNAAGYLVSERRCIDEACTGGFQQRVALVNGSIPNGYNGVYSPNGARVAYTKDTGSTPYVYIATATGGSARRLIHGRIPTGSHGHSATADVVGPSPRRHEPGVAPPGRSPTLAIGIQAVAVERCSDLAEPLCAQLMPVWELVASIPAPRCDHRQHEDPTLA
jgi:hypothetical protein